MADIVKTPPNPPEVTPPPVDPNDDKNKSPENLKINEIIQEQIEAFKKDIKKQFDDEYKSKLSDLQNSKNELEEKKHRIAIMDELKAVNMDSSLIDFVYDKDIEASKIKIKQLDKIIKAEVQKGVEERIHSSIYIPPKNDENADFNSRKTKPRYFI